MDRKRGATNDDGRAGNWEGHPLRRLRPGSAPPQLRPTQSHRNSPVDASRIDSVFVYGTLKQGQCRAPLWPAKPREIVPAWVRGKLFSRSDYPALRNGDDRVRGELWRFPVELMPSVLETLDEIEGTNQPGEPDLYHRVQLEVFDLQGRPLGIAHTYRYATDPQQDGFQPIEANPLQRESFVSWPADQA